MISYSLANSLNNWNEKCNIRHFIAIVSTMKHVSFSRRTKCCSDPRSIIHRCHWIFLFCFCCCFRLLNIACCCFCCCSSFLPSKDLQIPEKILSGKKYGLLWTGIIFFQFFFILPIFLRELFIFKNSWASL